MKQLVYDNFEFQIPVSELKMISLDSKLFCWACSGIWQKPLQLGPGRAVCLMQPPVCLIKIWSAKARQLWMAMHQLCPLCCFRFTVRKMNGPSSRASRVSDSISHSSVVRWYACNPVNSVEPLHDWESMKICWSIHIIMVEHLSRIRRIPQPDLSVTAPSAVIQGIQPLCDLSCNLKSSKLNSARPAWKFDGPTKKQLKLVFYGFLWYVMVRNSCNSFFPGFQEKWLALPLGTVAFQSCCFPQLLLNPWEHRHCHGRGAGGAALGQTKHMLRDG